MFNDEETPGESEPGVVVLISKHSRVLGSLLFLSMFLIDAGDCSKVRDDSGILSGDSASITDPASLAVS